MDRYAVEVVVIQVSDMSATRYRVSAKTTPTNYLHRDVRSPSCAKYRNNLILVVFNLAVGWLIRQTAKLSGYTVYSMVPYMHIQKKAHQTFFTVKNTPSTAPYMQNLQSTLHHRECGRPVGLELCCAAGRTREPWNKTLQSQMKLAVGPAR